MKITKQHVLGIALGVALGAPVGAELHHMTATAPAASATPVMLRWLDEGPGRLNRYALGVGTTLGANVAPHEIVCEHDGSSPRLDGVIIAADQNVVGACQKVAECGGALSTYVSAAATTLTAPPIPADMARPTFDLGN